MSYANTRRKLEKSPRKRAPWPYYLIVRARGGANALIAGCSFQILSFSGSLCNQPLRRSLTYAR